MLLLISPAKTLDFESAPKTGKTSQPEFLEQATTLNKVLRKLDAGDLRQLMSVSDSIAKLNVERNRAWQPPFNGNNAKQAVLAFRGDVYTGLDTDSFSAGDFSYAQQHLRILSGLYGALKPLDLIQPYRLEMGTKLENPGGKNLYEFWGEQITDTINRQCRKLKTDTVVNLASNEYFKVIKPKLLDASLVSPEFRDYKNGDYKIISFYAKKARGLMARWIIQQRIEKPEQLDEFNLEGYRYSKSLSTEDKPVFTRKP